MNSIVARCPAEPSEEMAKFHFFGSAFAAAITSARVFSGRLPLTTQTSGATAVRASTSRSVSGLKSADFSTSGITAVLKALARNV